MLRIFWKKFWCKNIWLKVCLAQSYGRKCGFSGIFGNAGFFNFWSGGKYLGMLYQRGMGSDPLSGNNFYNGVCWLDWDKIYCGHLFQVP